MGQLVRFAVGELIGEGEGRGQEGKEGIGGKGWYGHIHRLAMSCLLEDLRRHVSWRTACRRQDVELLLIHDSAEPKIRNQ